jgi:hypothetical protein
MSSPSRATTVDGSDSDAAACPTTTNSLKQMNLTTDTGCKEMSSPSHAKTVDGSDSDAAACPTTTNNLKQMNPTIDTA